MVEAKSFAGERDVRSLKLERCPDVAFHVFARQHGQCQAFDMAQPIVSVVDAIEKMRNPGDIILSRDNLEAREALKHTASDHIGESELDGLWQGHVAEQHFPPAEA